MPSRHVTGRRPRLFELPQTQAMRLDEIHSSTVAEVNAFADMGFDYTSLDPRTNRL